MHTLLPMRDISWLIALQSYFLWSVSGWCLDDVDRSWSIRYQSFATSALSLRFACISWHNWSWVKLWLCLCTKPCYTGNKQASVTRRRAIREIIMEYRKTLQFQLSWIADTTASILGRSCHMVAQREPLYNLWKVQMGHTNVLTHVKDTATAQCQQRVRIREANRSA